MKLGYVCLIAFQSFNSFATSLVMPMSIEKGVSHLKVLQIKALNFGNISIDKTSIGTFVIEHTEKHLRHNIALIGNTIPSIGQFAIFGNKNRSVNISVEKNVILKNNLGNEIMVLLNGNNHLQQINSNGIAEFKIGGKLEIMENHNSGLYHGTYNITVSY